MVEKRLKQMLRYCGYFFACIIVVQMRSQSALHASSKVILVDALLSIA